MTVEFHAERRPDETLLAEVAALAPDNPFHSPAYAEAMRALGSQVVILSLRKDGALVSACPAFTRSGRLNRSLEITSLPALADEGVFWEGLQNFCRQDGVTLLEVNSFASTAARIPALPQEVGRKERAEYVLDLQAADLWRLLRKDRKHDVKQGRKAGLEVRRTTDAGACREHERVVASSMERRSARGERVPEDSPLSTCEALLRHGAGELFQAVRGGEVVASALVARAAEGAYYQSAGASAAGRECGAPTFLLFEVGQILQAEGCKLFNLGGAGPDERGLHEFKRGFGAEPVPLESAQFFLGGALRKKIDTTLKLLRHDRGELLRHLKGRVERYVVYSCDPAEAPPPPAAEEAEQGKLTDEELAGLPADREFLRAQSERLHRLKFNDAYGVFYQGQLAHISWLIPAEHDRRIPVRNLKLRDGEAEITNCVTWPEFRGLSLYPFAIRSLCRVAHAQGVRRVFMICDVKNLASQRGMQKAGLKPHGRIVRLAFSYLPGEAGLTYRGHRWARAGGVPNESGVRREASRTPEAPDA
jgi:hypothetical protein